MSTRKELLAAGIGAGLTLSLGSPGIAATPNFKIEKPDVRIGASVGGAGFLPVYVAVDHTWKPAGITSDLITFRSDTELAQALAGDSVDVACISLDGLVALIAADQPCMA